MYFFLYQLWIQHLDIFPCSIFDHQEDLDSVGLKERKKISRRRRTARRKYKNG